MHYWTDYQKPRQLRRQWFARLLLHWHVDHSSSDGIVVLRHDPRLLHLLQ
jgi:hypothetical protein